MTSRKVQSDRSTRFRANPENRLLLPGCITPPRTMRFKLMEDVFWKPRGVLNEILLKPTPCERQLNLLECSFLLFFLNRSNFRYDQRKNLVPIQTLSTVYAYGQVCIWSGTVPNLIRYRGKKYGIVPRKLVRFDPMKQLRYNPSKHVLLPRYNMKVTCNVTMLFLWHVTKI